MILKFHMPSVCLKCKQVYAFQPTTPQRAHSQSHGYCRPCAQLVKKQILKKP